MTKRVKLLGALIVAFILCVCIGLVPLFTTQSSNKVSAAATNPLRYDSANSGNELATYYMNHWKNGQGQRVSGETSGRWYFGYGDISDSTALSFTQAIFASKGDADNNSQYTTGNAHQMHYQFDTSTRMYTSASTQTMYVFEAEADGEVSFSGFAAKSSSTNMETFIGEQNGLSTCWLPGVNWGDTKFDWTSGDKYVISMWKVKTDGSKFKILEREFSTEFAYLFENSPIKLAAGDKVVFGYKMTALGSGHDEWGSNALWLLSSQFTAKDFSACPNYDFVGQTTGLATSYLNHWSANGAKASGETNGTWKYGTGSITTTGYSFTAATQNTTVAEDTKKWGTSPNDLSWGFSVGTSTTTASIYELTADQAGTFTFSGIVAKSNYSKDLLAASQNGVNTIWLNGINHTSADFNWYNGDSYKVGMYKVSGGVVTAIQENTFTSQYAWLVPQDPITLQAGDKIVFSLQAVAFGSLGSTSKSGTMMLLTSKAQTILTTTATVSNDSTQGTVNGIENGTAYEQGSTLNISITPQSGYKIASVSWNGANETVTPEGMTLTKTVESQANLVVTYEEIVIPTFTFDIANNDTQGTVTPNITAGASHNEGTAYSVEISAKAGYIIASVMVNGTEMLTGNVATYTATGTLTENTTIDITYLSTRVQAIVTYNNVMGYITGISNGTKYDIGNSLNITITPNSGYRIKSVKWNGMNETITSATGMTLSKEVTDAGLTLVVDFESTVESYQITLNNGAYGTIDGVTDGESKQAGDVVNFTVTANSGYVIASVKVNGVSPSGFVANATSGSYSTTITTDTEIIVTYAPESTSGGGEGGSGSGDQGGSTPAATKYKVTVNYDKTLGAIRGVSSGSKYSEITLKITPNEGYIIKSLTVNGEEVEVENNKYFEYETEITETTTIEIEFGVAVKMVKGFACLSDLESVAPVGIAMLVGAVAMLIVKKRKASK